MWIDVSGNVSGNVSERIIILNNGSGNSNLLLIAERFPPDLGGVARSASRTAAAIARLGWNVHVLAWTKTLPPGALETLGKDAPNCPVAGVTLHRVGLFSNWDFSLQHTSNVLEWLQQQNQFSVIWGHYVYPAGYMAVVFAELAGIASTVSARGNDIDRLMFPPGDFARLLWTLDRATTVSCVSRQLANKVEMLLGQRNEVVVLPNVVDSDLFCPAEEAVDAELRVKLGIAPGEAVLGFCGELRHKKGLPFLLSALTEVRQNRGACLLVIGEVRPREQAQLAAFAATDSESASRILVSGNLESQEEVARHLRICDLVLQPSVWDGLPNAMLEAMACGKIVLASNAGGIPDVIENKVNGFIIPKAQLHRLGTAILEVLELPQERAKQIEAAARARVTKDFHEGLEAERLTELLTRVSSLKPSGPSNS